MYEQVVHGRPLSILLDRSRDAFAGRTALWLRPTGRFRVTDSRRTLRRRDLRDYDILLMCGLHTRAYTSSECEAIGGFVRAGGSLVLAAGAGHFEQGSGRSIDALALQAVARMFGFAFLSPSGLPADLEGRRGLAPEQLRLTPEGRRWGVRREDLYLLRPGPIRIPKRAQVLLRGPGRTVVAAWAPYGRGRVLVTGDHELWNARFVHWGAIHWMCAMTPPRIRVRPAPPASRGIDYRKRRSGAVTVYHAPGRGPAAHRVLAAARAVWDEFHALFRVGRKATAWEIAVSGGLHGLTDWHSQDPIRCELGSDFSDAQLYAMLARLLAERFHLTRTEASQRTLLRPVQHYAQLHVLERFGFTDEASRRRDACGRETRGHEVGGRETSGRETSGRETSGQISKTDLGRFYSESPETAAQRRFWDEVVSAFGADVFARFWRAVPVAGAGRHLERGFYTDLDRFAFYLATVVGKRAYDWIEREGHTLRRVPLAKPGSKALGRATTHALEAVAADPAEAASDRHGAVTILAQRLASGGRSLSACASVASAASAASAVSAASAASAVSAVSAASALSAASTVSATGRASAARVIANVRRLIAATRLLHARDRRGLAPARKALRRGDKGLRAVAALLLVAEMQDPRGADVLAALAGNCDARFQLAAGHALRCAGDPRAAAFAFERVEGCHWRTAGHEAHHKVFAVVDGFPVANTFCLPCFFDAPHRTAYSTWYVDWVHTDVRWRRRGLARQTMKRSLRSAVGATCATTSLHTGTRNLAHTLYREHGLLDLWVMHVLHKNLAQEPAVSAPRGIRIRPATAADHNEVSLLVNEMRDERIMEPARLGLWPADAVAFVATEGKRIIGVASAQLGREVARLELLVVRAFEAPRRPKVSGLRVVDPDLATPPNVPARRARVAAALLARVHRACHRTGHKTIRKEIFGALWDDFLFEAVRRAGYSTKRGGLVELQRIDDLTQFLNETRGTFESRLRASRSWADWEGDIVLEGGPLRARMSVTGGQIRVTAADGGTIGTGAATGTGPAAGTGRAGATGSATGSATGARAATGTATGTGTATATGKATGTGTVRATGKAAPDPFVRITGSRAAVTRIALGVSSPVEEHLQLEALMSPTFSTGYGELIEVLFPRVVRE